MKKLFLSFYCVLIGLFLSAQQWEHLTPLKLNSEIHGISFLNSQEGVMTVYTDSRIYKTDNGGMSWNALWTPFISTNFYGIDWVSPDTIFTAGSNGDLYRSIDAGATWVDINSNTPNFLYDIKFFDLQNGIAVGNLGTIIRTQDGGSTWSIITSNTTNRLVDIFMLDATHWYITGWGGIELFSSDMGLTWSPLNTAVTTNFTCSYWLNANTGFITGAGNAIYKTTNAGSTWTLQTANVNLSSLNHIEFKDNLNGYAVGSLGSYYSTTNGGNTWTVNAALVNQDLFIGTYVPGLGAVVGGKSTIFRSNINLGSWAQIKSGTPRTVVSSLDFLNDNNGTFVGYVGTAGTGSNQMGIVQTNDGGQTWIVRAQGTSGGYYDVHFPNATTGYVVGAQYLAKTTNGGVNWTYTTPIPNVFNASVWFNDANTGFIGHTTGNVGISKTTNGGTSFTTSPNFVADEIYFINDLVGWAMPAVSSTMYKTTDGGNTWEYWTTPGTLSGRCMFFLDENTGWVGTLAGVNKTTDGGLTWQNTYLSSEVLAIQFSSPTNGYCVTSDGNLYFTSDGGTNWESVLSPNSIMPGGNCAAFSDNYCYIGAGGGEIYRVELGCGGISAGNIYGDLQWCENQTGYLAINQVANAVSYDWTFPSGWTFDANDNDEYVTPIAGPNGGLISVTVTNQCGETATAQVAVSVSQAVQELSTANVPSPICSEAAIISIPSDTNASEYVWTWTSGIIATANANELMLDINSGSGTAYVYSSNDCGVSNTLSIPISVGQSPEVTFDLIDDTQCIHGIYPISGGSPQGGIYSGPGVTGAGTINTNLVGNDTLYINYTYINEQGCSGTATDTLFILETNFEPENIIGNLSVCSGSTELYHLSNEEQYSGIMWVYPAYWQVNLIENAIEIIDIQESGILSVLYTNSCGQTDTSEVSIEVLSFSTDITYSISNTSWCSGSTESISFNSNYEFELSSGLNYIMDDLGTLQLFGNPGSHSISIWDENECFTTDTTVVDVIVIPSPFVIFEIGGDTLCGNYPNLVNVSPADGVLSGGFSEGLFVWWGDLNFEEGWTTYTYTFSSDNGCSSSATDSVYFYICGGVDDFENVDINMYPNPASNILNISTNKQIIKEIKIVNLLGEMIYFDKPLSSNAQVNTSHIGNGLYTISVTDEVGNRTTEKFIVQH